MEVSLILVPVLVFAFAKIALDHRAQARAGKLRLLEEALKNPALDRATIESLTHQLTGRRPLRNDGPPQWMAVALSFGWIALFVGIGVLIGGAMFDQEWLTIAGLVTGVTGFGLVTWPFALRELEARRHAQ